MSKPASLVFRSWTYKLIKIDDCHHNTYIQKYLRQVVGFYLRVLKNSDLQFSCKNLIITRRS